MAKKVTSLASGLVGAIQNGYKITDSAYLEKLKESEDIIGGQSTGLNVLVATDEEYYLAYITGQHTFANLPKLFEIEPLEAPGNLSPADQDTDVAVEGLEISWDAVDGAESYEVEVTLAGEDPVVHSTEDTSLALDAEYDSTYTYRVRAIGPEIYGTWTEETSFTTETEEEQ